MFSRRRADADLDSELQFHVAQLIDEHMAAGLSREEATRRARLDFGGDLQTREACREVRGVQWFDTLTRDLGTVRRLFFTTPGFSAAIVTVLAVGIGTTAAIVALVNAVIIRPLPYPNADRLVSVYHAASGTALPMTGLSTGTLLHYQSENRVFDDIASYQDEVATLTAPGEPGRIRIAVASPSLFTTLNVRPFLGRFPVTGDVDTDADGLFLHATVAISHDLWVRRFGADPSVVGRSISIGAWRSLTIVGVTGPEFHFPHAETQVWIGAPPEVRNNRSRASIRGLYDQGIARLKPGVTEAEANQDLQRMVAMLPAAFSDVTAEQLQEIGFQAAVLPLKDTIVGDVRLPLLLLITMGAFLLLITWANVTNLSLVRAGRLRREVAVARALGAGERHLVHRLLSESIALAAIGGLLGLLLANRAIALGFGFDVEQIPRLNEVSMDGAVYALVLALAATSALLLGAVAFVSTRRADLTEALRGATGRVSDGRRQQMGRRVLVAAQVALSVPLLVGSALLAESFWQLNRVDLGFQSAGALTFTVPIPPTMSPAGDYYNGVARIHADIRRRIRALPGVTATESTSIFPLMSGHRGYLLRLSAGSPAPERADDWHYTYLSYATPNYFSAMGMPLKHGRTFRAEDLTRDAAGVVVSASLARAMFGEEDVVGRQVRLLSDTDAPPYTVVGVVGDIHAGTVQEGLSHLIYLPHVYPPLLERVTGVVSIFIPDAQTYVVRTSLPPASLLPEIRRIVSSADPRLAIARPRELDQVVADSMARNRLTMVLLLLGSGVALFLGLVGIYGVMAFAVGQRTNELGVRIALGANPVRVVAMLTREGAGLAAAGIAAGLTTAYALTGFLRNLLYEVSPTDPRVFATVATLVFGAALLASYVPARRAGRIDPVRALKAE